MADKEAKARIKINKLLEDAGWRFFDSAMGKATIQLESSIKMDLLCLISSIFLFPNAGKMQI
jgi:type I restriction enzyme R subunit